MENQSYHWPGVHEAWDHPNPYESLISFSQLYLLPPAMEIPHLAPGSKVPVYAVHITAQEAISKGPEKGDIFAV